MIEYLKYKSMKIKTEGTILGKDFFHLSNKILLFGNNTLFINSKMTNHQTYHIEK